MGVPSRFNDDSLEWAIAAARAGSAVLAVVWVAGVFAAIILASWRMVFLAVAALVLAALAGWWGWGVMGNEGWRRSRGVRPPEH